MNQREPCGCVFSTVAEEIRYCSTRHREIIKSILTSRRLDLAAPPKDQPNPGELIKIIGARPKIDGAVVLP